MKEGTAFFTIRALLPVVESFGFADGIRGGRHDRASGGNGRRSGCGIRGGIGRRQAAGGWTRADRKAIVRIDQQGPPIV